MQHQYQDSKILKHEDEMTDISMMPKETLDRIAAKPAYTQTDAPASQGTTMQSVSMGEVPKEGQEDILGSVASIHDQMQPGSFMSPISDRKSGSIENFSTEDKATSTEPSLLKEGVDAVKEAFYISKEERAEIKDVVVTEAKALGEAATYFAQVAAEKIEGLYHAAAGKITQVVHNIEKDLGLAGDQASKELKSGASNIEKSTSELKSTIQKKTYLMRKSLRRQLKNGRKSFENIEKKAGMGAGFAKVFIREEAKDLKRRARRFQKDWKKDSKDTKSALKKSLQEKGRKVDHKYTSLENEAKKNITSTTESILHSLQETGKMIDHKYTELENQAKQYLKHEIPALQGKAQALGTEFVDESNKAIGIMKKEGKELQSRAEGKARQYKRDFEDDNSMIAEYLRGKARYLRSGARRVMNEVSRSAYLAKFQLGQKAEELKGQFENKSQDFSSDNSNKFLLDFSASEWNNNSFESSRFSDDSNSSKYLLEIPSSEWNFSNAEASRLRAGFLNTRAQGWIDRASKEFSLAQKKFESGDYKKDARTLYNKASKKAGEVQSMIKSSVDQMIDSASGKLADTSDKLNKQFASQGKGQELKKDAKGFMESAAEVGREVMGELSDAADKSMRFMVEKKANLQYQAELLSMDKFPSQQALARKEAINSEIRSLHKDSNKENLSQ